MSEAENIPLRVYIERIFDEREKTLVLTAKNLEHRLDGLNNLRSEVISDRQTFLTIKVYEVAHAETVRRVSTLEANQNKIIGVAVALIAVAGLIGFMAARLWK